MVILVLVLVLVMVAVLVMFPGKAGKDHRVKFLAPGIAGWDLGEERLLGGFSLGLCKVLGENSTCCHDLWLPWGEFPNHCGAIAGNWGTSP